MRRRLNDTTLLSRGQPILRSGGSSSSSRGRWVADTCTGTPGCFVEGKERVYLHDGEVVAKKYKRGDVDNMFRLVPEVWKELGRTRCH